VKISSNIWASSKGSSGSSKRNGSSRGDGDGDCPPERPQTGGGGELPGSENEEWVVVITGESEIEDDESQLG
jgi:hypothetical protein